MMKLKLNIELTDGVYELNKAIVTIKDGCLTRMDNGEWTPQSCIPKKDEITIDVAALSGRIDEVVQLACDNANKIKDHTTKREFCPHEEN